MEASEKDVTIPLSESAGYYSKRSELIDSGEDAWFYDGHHPMYKDKLPSQYSDASPNSYVEVTDNVALMDTHMSWYTVQTMKGRPWTIDDYNITMWSDRGKGRAQLVKYRRRQASLNENTANALSIVRVVMGNHLIGFLFCNAYGFSRGIPYHMLSVTSHGTGCLEKAPEEVDEDPNWLSTRWVANEDVSDEIKEMRKKSKMIDLCELFHWGYWGFDYDEGEYCEIKNKKKVKHVETDETEDVDVGSDREQYPGYV